MESKSRTNHGITPLRNNEFIAVVRRIESVIIGYIAEIL